MVHKIIDNRFRVFIESFLVASVIFILGFSIGFYLENHRTSQVIQEYKLNEIEALDLKLQNYNYQLMDNKFCDNALNQNLIFADKVYDSGLILEKFEESNQITKEIEAEKAKYVLLKTELWLNTMLLKEKCDANLNTIVYFYSSDPSNTLNVAKQKIISNTLKDIKGKYQNQVILLPIAGDLNLGIVNLQMENYHVESLPSIVINEKTTLEGFNSIEDIEKYLQYT